MLDWNIRISDEIEMVENKGEVEVFYFPKTIDFSTMNGTINFVLTSINYILKYGNRNVEANRYLRKIRGILSKISIDNVRYDNSTDFEEYKKAVSKVLMLTIDKERIKQNEGYFGTLEDVNIKEKQILVVRRKDLRGRELERTPEYIKFKDYVEHFILVQLDYMRLCKDTKAHLISEYNCHIEIVTAVNYLISAAGYLCRCGGSTNIDGLFVSDRMEMENLINLAEVVVKRIKYVQF